MRRGDGRHHAHIQGSRPAAAAEAPSPAAPAAEERAAVPGGNPAGWRLAGLLWAITFLFLSALMVFDLIAGVFHR
jgi:hypothetical protein